MRLRVACSSTHHSARLLTTALPTPQARNEADSLVYSAERSLAEFKAQLPTEVTDEISTAIATARSAKEGEDLEALKAAVEALSKAVQKIGENIRIKSDDDDAQQEASQNEGGNKNKGG